MSLRWNVVLIGAVPMAMIQWLFFDQVRAVSNPMTVILFALALFFAAGRGLVRKLGATFLELVLSVFVGSAPLLMTEFRQMLVFGWYVGGAGLSLLPLFDDITRRSSETSVPITETRNVAAVLSVILLIAGGTVGEDLQSSVCFAAMIALYLTVPALTGGLVMVLIGKTRDALRFCTPIALAAVFLLALASIVGMPEY